MGRVKRIWYLSPMRAAKVQASLRIRAVSPEPPLLAHTSSESRGTFRQKSRSLVPLNCWACAVKICHDGMLEDTNSLEGVQIKMYCCYKTSKQTQKKLLRMFLLKLSLLKFPLLIIIESRHDKTNKLACAPSENSDQPGHPHSLIRIFTVRMEKVWVLSYPLSAQRRL